jgi:DoxX-like family
VPLALAPWVLFGAALLDVVLGVAMWFKRLRLPVYRVQMAVIVFYTLVISVFLPEYWARPYGPVIKNLPLLGLIYALLRLEQTHRRLRR